MSQDNDVWTSPTPPHQMSTQKNEHNPETELKPCPFCGGNASYHSRFDVKCGICGAEINSLNPTETWNRRITPPTDTTGSGREGETPTHNEKLTPPMALCDILQSETQPIDGHGDPGAVSDAWRSLREQIEFMEYQVEALRRDGEIVDYLATLWDSEGIGHRLMGKLFLNVNGSFRDAIHHAIDSAQRQEGV